MFWVWITLAFYLGGLLATWFVASYASPGAGRGTAIRVALSWPIALVFWRLGWLEDER